MGKKYDIQDPILYEVFKHRLWAINERSHATLGKVSGSPVVIDAHEYLCAIHKANGDAVTVNSGVLYHAIGMDFGIKHLLKLRDQGEIEIEDNDQFLINDPFIAAMHAVDMGIVKPVFYQGKLIAWVASLFHTPAVPCSMEPAGACSSATEAYQEGFRSSSLVIVKNKKVDWNLLNNLASNARDPDMLGLDHISKISANNVAAVEVLELIDQWGLDYINFAFDRIIDETEGMCKQTIRELPNGKWTTILYLDTTGRQIKPRKVQCTITKSGENLLFDYTGTAKQEPGAVQCALPAGISHIFVILASQLFWQASWNHGILKAIDYKLPKGSLVNADFPFAVSYSVSMQVIQSVAHRNIAHMQFLREKYRRDVNASWAGGGSPKIAGVNQYGKRFESSMMTGFSAGNGARPNMDGVDTGGLMLTPESEIGNVETHENFYPLLYLWRKEASETCGYGKFRGGMGLDHAFIVHDSPEKEIICTGVPIGDTLTFAHGLFGGYPGSLRGTFVKKNVNIRERLKNGDIPVSMDEFEGDEQLIQSVSGSYALKEDDVIQYIIAGGGGYGDPLERDYALVIKDVRDGVISLDRAKKLYGVIIDPANFRVDTTQTEKEREKIRADRMRRGKSLKKDDFKRTLDKVDLAKKKQTGIQMSESLYIVDEGQQKIVVCSKCGFVFCRVSENYKLHSLVSERLPSEIGFDPKLHPKDDSGMIYREFCCPGCGVMLDVEPVMKGDPIIQDCEIEL